MPIYEYRCRKCKAEYEVFYKTQSAVKEEEPKEKYKNPGDLKMLSVIAHSKYLDREIRLKSDGINFHIIEIKSGKNWKADSTYKEFQYCIKEYHLLITRLHLSMRLE